MSFLRNKVYLALTLALLAQAALYYTAAGGERVPLLRPLAQFPAQFDVWRHYQDVPVDDETLAILKADETLNRLYTRPDQTIAGLFIAYFKTQRTGQTPHSPQNCLPGSGWVPSRTGRITIPIPGRSDPITVNQYVVSKGDEKSVVLYWYQSRDRVIASEFSAKFWLVADSIRYRRSDTALVRVVVPVTGADEESAARAGVEFIRVSFPQLKAFFAS